MKKIQDHLKEAGIVNAILLVIALVFSVIVFIKNAEFMSRVSMLMHFIAYIVGLAYALSGYKKSSAQFYKIFMAMFLIAALLDTINGFSAGFVNVVDSILWVIAFLATVPLAFGKDIGEKPSVALVFGILAIYLIKFIVVLCTAGANFLLAAATTFGGLVLSCVASIFVLAKYKDKAERGSF